MGTALSQSKPDPLLRQFMPELDSLRGIAIAGVVCLHGLHSAFHDYHFGKWGRLVLSSSQVGWVGVNLFFVLSGFLITGILLDSRNRSDYYKRFYIRRALRILPAYYALLVLLLLLGQASLAYVGLGFVYLANITNFFGVAQDYGPLWSLAVEEHFYLLWPTMIRRLRTKSVAIAAFAICALVPVLRGLSFAYGYRAGLDSYTWFVVDGLAAGALLAVLLRSGASRRLVWTICGALLIVSVSLSVVGAPYGVLTRERVLGAMFQFSLIFAFFSGVLLLFLLVGTGRYRWLVRNRTLMFLGFISYGLYLIHLLVFRLYDKFCRHYAVSLVPQSDHFSLVILRFVITAGAAVLLAYLSRITFEEKFLRYKDRPSALAPSAERISVSEASS